MLSFHYQWHCFSMSCFIRRQTELNCCFKGESSSICVISNFFYHLFVMITDIYEMSVVFLKLSVSMCLRYRTLYPGRLYLYLKFLDC